MRHMPAEISNADDLNDYLVDAEYREGEKFTYENITYTVCDITDFIRSYGADNYSQVGYNINSFLEQGLIIFSGE